MKKKKKKKKRKKGKHKIERKEAWPRGTFPLALTLFTFFII